MRLLALLALVGTCDAAVKFASVFYGQVVLQREAEVAVWGTGEPGQVVEVRLDAALAATAVVDAAGGWNVTLAPQPTSWGGGDESYRRRGHQRSSDGEVRRRRAMLRAEQHADACLQG